MFYEIELLLFPFFVWERIESEGKRRLIGGTFENQKRRKKRKKIGLRNRSRIICRQHSVKKRFYSRLKKRQGEKRYKHIYRLIESRESPSRITSSIHGNSYLVALEKNISGERKLSDVDQAANGRFHRGIGPSRKVKLNSTRQIPIRFGPPSHVQ